MYSWIGPLLVSLGVLLVAVGIVWGSYMTYQHSQHESPVIGEGLLKRGRWAKFLDWALEHSPT